MKRVILKVEVYLPDDVPVGNLALDIDHGMSNVRHTSAALRCAHHAQIERLQKDLDDAQPCWRVTLDGSERVPE